MYLQNPVGSLDGKKTEQVEFHSAGKAVEEYCSSIIRQAEFSFDEKMKAKQFEADINNALREAKERSKNYLHVTQPKIISTLSDVLDFCDLYTAVGITAQQQMNEAQWLAALKAMREKAIEHGGRSETVMNELISFKTDTEESSGKFAGLSEKLNAVVQGNSGDLQNLKNDMNELDTNITWLNIGAFGAALGAIAGGAIAGGGIGLMLTGAGLLKGGLIAAGGVTMVGGGIGLMVAAIDMAKKLSDEKRDLAARHNLLEAEVKATTAVSSALGSLAVSARSAATASQAMSTAWGSLATDLDHLATNLKKGIVSTDYIQQLHLTTAEMTFERVREDATTIKHQMAGVEQIKAPSNTLVADHVREIVMQRKAA
jgi:hypothetical protein